MELTEIGERIANIHNTISMATVSGDSVIYLAQAMMDCRKLVNEIQQELNKKD